MYRTEETELLQFCISQATHFDAIEWHRMAQQYPSEIEVIARQLSRATWYSQGDAIQRDAVAASLRRLIAQWVQDRGAADQDADDLQALLNRSRLDWGRFSAMLKVKLNTG